jgi:hypothetical protein
MHSTTDLLSDDHAPHHGLAAMCSSVVTCVQTATHADVVALMLSKDRSAPQCIGIRMGVVQAPAEVVRLLEDLLHRTHGYPIRFVQRHRWDPRPCVGLPYGLPVPQTLVHTLQQLSDLFGVQQLQVAPLLHDGKRWGYLLLGRTGVHAPGYDCAALEPLLRAVTAALANGSPRAPCAIHPFRSRAQTTAMAMQPTASQQN